MRSTADRVAELEAEIQGLRALNLYLTETNHRLQELAHLDPLTGLANRRIFDQVVKVEVERALRTAQPMALLLVDVDHFKLINDARGHQVGDAVLQQLAQRLQEGRRLLDLVARYGGEEFAILLQGAEHKQAAWVADGVRQRIAAAPFPQDLRVTVSIGIACCLSDGSTAAGLIEAADQALYEAKRRGRNRVRITSLSFAHGEVTGERRAA